MKVPRPQQCQERGHLPSPLHLLRSGVVTALLTWEPLRLCFLKLLSESPGSAPPQELNVLGSPERQLTLDGGPKTFLFSHAL